MVRRILVTNCWADPFAGQASFNSRLLYVKDAVEDNGPESPNIVKLATLAASTMLVLRRWLHWCVCTTRVA
jgi:hypothetical protein